MVRRLALIGILASWCAACLPNPDYPEFTHGTGSDTPTDVVADVADVPAPDGADAEVEDPGVPDEGVIPSDLGEVGEDAADPGLEDAAPDAADVPPDPGADEGVAPEDACLACPDAAAEVCGPCGFDIVVDVTPPCTSFEDCDDGNPCTDDTCDPVLGCQHVNRAGGCDDHDACTQADQCVDGKCTAGTPVDCDDKNPCTADSCAPATGCAHDKLEGECAAARCEGARFYAAVSCTPEGICPYQAYEDCVDTNSCTDQSCDPSRGCVFTNNVAQCASARCQNTPVLGFVPAAFCADGACQTPEVQVCDDGNQCTDDKCTTAAGCSHTNNAKVCSPARCDALVYSPAVSCKDGACGTATPIDCDDGNPCTDDSCSAAQGGCKHVPNTALCDDGDECTSGDTCNAGVCKGVGLDCNDNNPCTLDSCDPVDGCSHLDVPVACAAAYCIGTTAFVPEAICDQGACPAQAEVSCDDGNPCTDDACDPVAGCTHGYNTLACDDGNPCTSGDQCALGACTGGGPTDCDDANPCTDDGCDPLVPTGCTHVNNTAPCRSGFCVAGSWISPGTCVDGACPDATSVFCDDGNPCTGDLCDAVTGCAHVNNQVQCRAASCDAAGFHPAVQCTDGACPVAATVPCDDGNECTTDSCTVAGGCAHENRIGTCTDGNGCTVGDQCVGGACIPGSPRNCDDGLSCTADSCNPADGLCTHEPQGDFCLIAATCIPDGTTSPLNPCMKCVAATSRTGWTGIDGGTCAIYPNGTTTCVAGDCQYQCDDLRGDCDPDRTNGCESDLQNDAAHCGDCVTKCDPGVICLSGVCEPNP